MNDDVVEAIATNIGPGLLRLDLTGMLVFGVVFVEHVRMSVWYIERCDVE